MHVQVAIIGAGLAGLHTAWRLDAAGVEAHVFEARARLGGRILSIGGFDLGPAWFWPKTQPRVATLLQGLGVNTFPQFSDGDLLFEYSSADPPRRAAVGFAGMQAMRIAGGAGVLVSALAEALPPERIHLETALERAALKPAGVGLNFRVGETEAQSVDAECVVLALPPRLAHARIDFSPPLEERTARIWAATPTWMAPHAKFVARYRTPFWRGMGLSGAAQSMVGPLGEIHDATEHAGEAALFGFVTMPPSNRTAVGDAVLERGCLEQLVRLFGANAADPVRTHLQDWAAEPWTSTVEDGRHGGHPRVFAGPWVTGDWASRLSMAGSEVSSTEPGYLAGAVEASDHAVSKVRERLGVR